jgi:hypothetical protein
MLATTNPNNLREFSKSLKDTKNAIVFTDTTLVNSSK